MVLEGTGDRLLIGYKRFDSDALALGQLQAEATETPCVPKDRQAIGEAGPVANRLDTPSLRVRPPPYPHCYCYWLTATTAVLKAI